MFVDEITVGLSGDTAVMTLKAGGTVVGAPSLTIAGEVCTANAVFDQAGTRVTFNATATGEARAMGGTVTIAPAGCTVGTIIGGGTVQ